MSKRLEAIVAGIMAAVRAVTMWALMVWSRQQAGVPLVPCIAGICVPERSGGTAAAYYGCRLQDWIFSFCLFYPVLFLRLFVDSRSVFAANRYISAQTQRTVLLRSKILFVACVPLDSVLHFAPNPLIGFQEMGRTFGEPQTIAALRLGSMFQYGSVPYVGVNITAAVEYYQEVRLSDLRGLRRQSKNTLQERPKMGASTYQWQVSSYRSAST